jgi:hypothetical protein|nr:hypothetical protein [Kofleriaceae bacterium]
MYRAAVSEDVVGDAGALKRLWVDNLPVGALADAKLQWAYLDSPSGRGEAVLLRDAAGQPIGCAGVLLRELSVDGTPVRAALLADFAVDRAHRVGFPAIVMQRTVKRHVEQHYDLSYGFPNQHAVAVHLRTGYHQLGKMQRYVRVLRHGPYLERKTGMPVAAAIAGAAIDTGRYAILRAKAIVPSRGLALDWLAEPTPRFDRLWELGRKSVRIACRRDAAFLRWRFARKFDEQARFAVAVERASGDVRAYAVVAGETGQLAELRDLFGVDLESTSALLSLLVPALYDRGHTAISVRFLGDPRVPSLLGEYDFQPRGGERVVIVSPGPKAPVDAATLRATANWYITDLDEDT